MSRVKMVDEEFPGLIAAQVMAAGSKGYNHWREWMRGAFSYTLARRMADALGYSQPSEEFYNDMKLVGERIMKEMYAIERVNYTFRSDAESACFEGGEETSSDCEAGGTLQAGDNGCNRHVDGSNIHPI
jgi:hypothetical protein